jgi:hypothetical protein
MPVLKTARMRVLRQTLVNSSKHFKIMLNTKGQWKEASQDEVILEDDTVTSIELWFRVLHSKMTEDMFEIPVEEIWHALAAGRKYFLKMETLQDWFGAWWGHEHEKYVDFERANELLYPCQELNHAHGFAEITKMLVYDKIGHISEINPTYHRHLHLGHNVIRESEHFC